MRLRVAPSHVAAVTRVVGQLRVGAAVGRGVPDVQVHVGAERVEAGVLEGPAGGLRLPVEGGAGRGDGGHGGRALRLEVALVRVALGGPDGPEQAGHGRQAAGPREVRLRSTSTQYTVRILHQYMIHRIFHKYTVHG